MSAVSVFGSGRSVITNGIFDEDGAGGGEPDFLPQAGVAVAHGVEPVPADGAEEGGAVDGGDAAVFADAVGDGVLVWHAGMGLRRDFHGEDGCVARLDEFGDVEAAADEGALDGSGLGAVDPDFGGEVGAVEVEPDLAVGVFPRDGEGGAVPVRSFVEGFRDDGLAVVLAVGGFGVEAVVDHAGEDGAGDGGGNPAGGLIALRGDSGAGVGDFRGVLELPSGVELDRGGKSVGLRKCGTRCYNDAPGRKLNEESPECAHDFLFSLGRRTSAEFGPVQVFTNRQPVASGLLQAARS